MSMDDIPQEVLDELINQYLAEQGGEQPMLTGEQSTFYGMMPQLDFEGDPYDINKQLNAMQDVNQIMADPVFQGLSGPGAFGARAFQPRVRMEVVESPEYVRWQNYLNTPDSLEGMIAAELQGGGTPTSAVRKIREKIAENPEGALFQELSSLYPQQNNAGAIPGTIDWGIVNQAATEIDTMRGAIPQIGNAGFTMEDGTVVGGGGEIMEVMGPNGPQLVRRTEEPTEAMEKYDELGIPYPTEQYSPEGLMGPDWTAAAEELEMGRGNQQALLDEYSRLYADYLQPAPTPRVTTRPATTEEPDVVTAGTTGEPLEGGPGIPDVYERPEGWTDWRSHAQHPWAGAAIPTIQRFNMIQDPNEWLEYFNAHVNELSDDDRAEVIGNIMMRGGPTARGGAWDQVVDQVSSNFMTETPQGGGLGDIEINLPDIGRDANPIVNQAVAITNPTEFRAFVEEHLDQLRPSDMADLAERATGMGMTIATGEDMDAWSNVAADLINGEGDLTPGAPEGDVPASATQVQGLMGTQTLGPNGQLPAGARSYVAPRGLAPDDPSLAAYRRFMEGEEPPPEPVDWTTDLPTAGELNRLTEEPYNVLSSMQPRSEMDQAMLRQLLGGYDPLSSVQAPRRLPAYAQPGADRPPSATDQQQQQAAQLEQQRANASGWTPTLIYDPWAMPHADEASMASNLSRGLSQEELRRRAAASWTPSIIYDPWATSQADEASMASNLSRGQTYQPPPGGYATLEEAAAAGSPVARRYLEENGPTPQGSPDYQPPPGGYPTLEQAAAAGSTAAADYLERNGPTPWSRPARHPEGPLGGLLYEAMLAQQMQTGEGPPATGLPRSETVQGSTGGLGGTAGAPRRGLGGTAGAPPRPITPIETGERYNVLGGPPRTGETSGGTGGRTTVKEPEYNVLGDDRTPQGLRRRRAEAAFGDFLAEKRRFTREKREVYNEAWGQALRAVYEAQLAGATPTNQVYAQRMQNVQQAGIPLQSNPRVMRV